MTPESSVFADVRERQLDRLKAMMREIYPRNSFWAKRFDEAGIDPRELRELAELRNWPLVTKDDLVADQAAHPPYGSNLTYSVERYCRLHQTSGTTTGRPLRWLDTPESWAWFMECWSQIYEMMEVRPDDRFCFPFSFGPFIGFWAGFEGAHRLGNLTLAAGGMSSSARLRLIVENEVTIVGCTPTYALRLAEIAESEGVDLAGGSVRALIVAGEPGGSVPVVRRRLESAWGARVFDHWGMTEIGSLATECAAAPGYLHVLETECIAEILDSETLCPVPPGTQGELVLTNLGRWGAPLIRYRTKDLVRAVAETCPCGRPLLRLEQGILGRTDDMITVRGNNVFPASLEAILREFDEIVELRITVQTRRSMQHVRIEIEPAADLPADTVTALVQRASDRIKQRLNFQAEVLAVPCNSLPRFEMKGRRFVRE